MNFDSFSSMKRKVISIFFILLILQGCPVKPPEPFYGSVTIPETPVNLGDINSIYDDYNSASPIMGNLTPLCFSSNRNSSGKDFDIILKMLDVYYLKSDGILHVGEDKAKPGTPFLLAYAENTNLSLALDKINTSSNELGPYLIPGNTTFEQIAHENYYIQHYTLLYASNESGNYNIRFTQNVTGDDYSAPMDVKFLNSPDDDLYPSISQDSTEIYFCSNREGNFDIYHTRINISGGIVSALSDSTERQIVKDSVLSSPYDDKCPFVIGNLLVFASNRPGGYGGFDLYYSQFEGGKWTEPVNFGEEINTAYDEYRPIVKLVAAGFTNNLMIFSSNRPGGKGGFDLYYVGIEKMTGIPYY